MSQPTPPPAPSFLRRARERAVAFVAEPASPRPLGVFRIGVAAVLLLQGLALSRSLLHFYGPHGLTQWSITDALATPGVPRLSWVADALAPRGVSPADCVRGVFVVYVGALAALLIGWHTRAAAALAWLTHLAMKVSAMTSVYGVDEFAHIALFYCIWMPVGHAFSLDVAEGRVSGAPSAAARLALRVLQLHLCVVYLSSGIEKASGPQWWNGEAIWRALNLPEFRQFDFTWLAQARWVGKLVCWQTLAVELGYAFLVWPRRTRKGMALVTIGMHVGIGVFMCMVSFASLMIVLTLSAFLVSAEPRSRAVASAGGMVPVAA
jgi:hypothetical protein